MNASVLVAVVSVVVVVLVRVAIGGLAFLSGRASLAGTVIPVGVAMLILAGIIVRHRLAWQWGRLVGLVGGIFLSISAVAFLSRAGEHPNLLFVAILLAMQGMPLLSMFFALGTQGARRHFRLICPNCGSQRSRAGNFLYTKIVCKDCDTSWD